MRKDKKDICANLHKKVVDFCNCTYTYKDKGRSGRWRRVEGGFSVLCGKGII